MSYEFWKSSCLTLEEQEAMKEILRDIGENEGEDKIQPFGDGSYSLVILIQLCKLRNAVKQLQAKQIT